ncbi:hypothetical protein DICVIV_03817 [Dictyocaulus viviparus]|uniref:Uncharacterized protein n=1 Tax=Dictyocaulus viviparus TaxID=29172 RepID=A0A0D8Y614_DICVI|nr:hypothetical protein DICVIV_03817 [Dictyocaulus viviparus]
MIDDSKEQQENSMTAPEKSSLSGKPYTTSMKSNAGMSRKSVSELIGVELPPLIDGKLNEIYRKIVDTSPLPDGFDYGHMFESYVWRAIFLTSFTIGVRIGNIELISKLFTGTFGTTFVTILTYVVLPAGVVYGDKKAEKEANIHERRIMLIGASSLLGILGSVVNQHYIITESSAPSYFLPGLVGLAVQVFGPQFGHDRITFLAISVGCAFSAGMLTMICAQDFTFGTLFGLTLSAICATINLQIIIANINESKKEMMASHLAAVLMALYQHMVFSRLFGEYSAEHKSTPSITKPLLYS